MSHPVSFLNQTSVKHLFYLYNNMLQDFIRGPLNCIDLLSILPFYISHALHEYNRITQSVVQESRAETLDDVRRVIQARACQSSCYEPCLDNCGSIYMHFYVVCYHAFCHSLILPVFLLISIALLILTSE